jgi:uncharacterized protein (UPF0332 family)
VNELAEHFWRRPMEALASARQIVAISPDGAGSRAFYAVFHAASAHFALEGRRFKKHSAIEAAVHRDLVHAGLLSEEAGERYSRLSRMRNTADYGGPQHIDIADAESAVEDARGFLQEIAALHPSEFKLSEVG